MFSTNACSKHKTDILENASSHTVMYSYTIIFYKPDMNKLCFKMHAEYAKECQTIYLLTVIEWMTINYYY